ncbi:RNA polymerase-associated protein RapA [Alphaproteobacteria bacterium SO-S41]|nr:RNA polymerase-associated protein RapA [Alphaproteobacteria bacterium SO-S41]
MARAVAFTYTRAGDIAVLSLREKRLLGTSVIPVAEWSAEAGATRTNSVALLFAAVEDERAARDGRPLVQVAGASMLLHPEFIAALSAKAAGDLGFPPPTSLALMLDTKGLVHERDFVLMTRWMHPGGRPARVDVSGALLQQDGQWRRIPEPLYSVNIAAAALAMPTAEADRFRTLADIGAILGAEGGSDPIGAAIESGGYLGSLRIHYASAFSLKLGAAGPFGFDPVLFGSKSIATAAEGEVLDEEADSLLPPAQQKAFAKRAFQHSDSIRPAYALSDGAYVFIDPQLRPALAVVRSYQRRPEADRKRFAANPRRIIREELGGDSADDTIESLFIETEQFSQRITGVDVWRTPVLPWVERLSNTWLPERVGLRLNDEIVPLKPSEVEPLLADVNRAIAEHAPSVSFQSHIVPATLQSRDALETLRAALEPPALEGDVSPEAETGETPVADLAGRGRLFLTVKENFEDVAYSTADSVEYADVPLVLPALLRTSLKPHQASGVRWLASAKAAGLPGVLLADDMGLGKTLQALVFIANLKQRTPGAPVLIVAPTGLLSNWEEEIERHLAPPYLGPIHRAFGPGLRGYRETGGRDTDTGQSSLNTDSWRSGGVVLTTYETMRDYHFSFARLRFATIIFDEIQKLKNPTSQQTRAAKTLNGAFMIGLTGTPVENQLQDLWSILDTVSPGLLGASKAFAAAYPESDGLALAGLNAFLREPKGRRPPPMLRRMKDDHLEGLPTKSVMRREIVMPEIQADRYRRLVHRAMAGRDTMTPRDGMLEAIQAMRAASLHPFSQQESAGLDDTSFIASSARLAWTIETLDGIAKAGEKALVFLENIDLQHRLAGVLQRRYKLPASPMRISGEVAGAKRQEMVRRFQNAPPEFDVMILSPRAGGVGLTLTAANHVIHLSRWWNPAVEDQSTDRVYRIGQTRPVTVYLPIAVHPDQDLRALSFDAKLDDILTRKRALSRDLLAPVSSEESELAQLFASVTGATTVGSAEPTAPLSEQGSDAAPVAPPAMGPAVYSDSSQAAVVFPARPVLTSTVAPPKVELDWTRREFAKNASRSLDEIFAPIAGVRLASVKIIDPYAIAGDENRAALSDVAFAICRAAPSVGRIVVEYMPPEDMKSDQTGESDGDQRIQAGLHMKRRFGSAAKTVPLHLMRRTRSRDRDFHDRSIEFTLDDPRVGAVKFVIDVGRGVLGLASNRFQTVVSRHLI